MKSTPRSGERSSQVISAHQRVQNFLLQVQNDEKTMDDVEEIREDLYKLVSRLEQFKEAHPEVEPPEFSSGVQRALEHLERSSLIQRFPFLKAASFL